MEIKGIAKAIVPESALGCLGYFIRSNMRYTLGGPFNGQRFRQRIFFDLLYHFPIKALVETGTYGGATTALFAATSLPVYTTEIHPRYFSYSKMRFLFNHDNVHLYKSDSRSFLLHLSEDTTVPKEDVFFYLDSHWGEDLPLREELKIIFSNWRRPLVMIDDFQVPNSNYGFDDYGSGKALDLSFIDPVISAYKIAAFFPAVDSAEETGARRGSIILCEERAGLELDARVKTLVRE